MSADRKLLESLPGLPAKMPGLEPLITVPQESGGVVVAGQAADGRLMLVVDRPTAGAPEQFTRKALTPLVSEDQIVAVAAAVAAGDRLIGTWPHAARVLAMGVLVAVAPADDEPPPGDPLDAPAPSPDPSPAPPASAPEAVAV